MNPHYTYLLILVLSLIGPLALSFDKKVAFYKSCKYLFPAMVLPAAFYIVWDILFTKNGVWSFSADHIIGCSFQGLPIEEMLFFFVVPYCCVFIYACIRAYFPLMVDNRISRILFALLALLFLTIAFLNNDRAYTYFTGLFAGGFMLLVLLLPQVFHSFHAKAFLIAYAIILIPFLIVNGFLTAIPVVLYNDFENLSIRLYTIPVEDTVYGLLLVLMNVVIYEKLKSRY
ncbi:MAG: lycopene cyclase domain-containing protein [Ferruginibacter sp.]